jgi:hypothetical protein
MAYERQCRSTAEQLRRFEETLERLRRRPATDDPNEYALRQLEEEALLSQLGDLRAELREHEAAALGVEVHRCVSLPGRSVRDA